MITADPKTDLGRWCREIDRMKPGECLDVDMAELQLIPGFEHNGAHWNPADRILENVAGSAWTHSYEVHPGGRHVTFRRHVEDGRRYYQSPDRR